MRLSGRSVPRHSDDGGDKRDSMMVVSRKDCDGDANTMTWRRSACVLGACSLVARLECSPEGCVILPCHMPGSMYCYSSLFVLDGECCPHLLLNPVTGCLADGANPSSSCLKADNRIRQVTRPVGVAETLSKHAVVANHPSLAPLLSGSVAFCRSLDDASSCLSFSCSNSFAIRDSKAFH